jgi:hypothetical protein
VGSLRLDAPNTLGEARRASLSRSNLIYYWFTEGLDTADLTDAKVLLRVE